MTTALIDADILVYESAFVAEESHEFEPGQFTLTANLAKGVAHFDNSVNAIADAVKADVVLLCLTDNNKGRQFRQAYVFEDYKAQRKKARGLRKPLAYVAMRQHARDNYTVLQVVGIEADDTLGILATCGENMQRTVTGPRVVCSIDKDLLTIPCRIYNWRKKTRRVVGVEEAFYNHMLQTLTGDATDGYPGIPRVGPVKAAQIIEPIYHSDYAGWKAEVWGAVVGAYAKKDLDEEYALSQARCAYILRYGDFDFATKEAKLWEPPS